VACETSQTYWRDTASATARHSFTARDLVLESRRHWWSLEFRFFPRNEPSNPAKYLTERPEIKLNNRVKEGQNNERKLRL
jgi:hypothetical protein